MKLTIVKCVKESDWRKKQEELTCKSTFYFELGSINFKKKCNTYPLSYTKSWQKIYIKFKKIKKMKIVQ